MPNVLTAADITEEHRQMYYDMYKDIHGVKPRWAFTNDSVAWLFNNWESLLAEQEAQEREALAALSTEHGVEFASWMAYYDFTEAKGEREYKEREAAKAARRAEMAKLRVPGIPAVINAWEHGDFG